MFKRYFVLTALLVLMPVWGFSQSSNWNAAIELNVSASPGDRIDLYTDQDGNHVIIQYANQLNYCAFKPDGTFIHESVIDNNAA